MRKRSTVSFDTSGCLRSEPLAGRLSSPTPCTSLSSTSYIGNSMPTSLLSLAQFLWFSYHYGSFSGAKILLGLGQMAGRGNLFRRDSALHLGFRWYSRPWSMPSMASELAAKVADPLSEAFLTVIWTELLLFWKLICFFSFSTSKTEEWSTPGTSW